jgi:hypothetical protein
MPRPIGFLPFRIGTRLLWSLRNNVARGCRNDLVSFPLALLVAYDDICSRGFCRPLGSRVQTLEVGAERGRIVSSCCFIRVCASWMSASDYAS